MADALDLDALERAITGKDGLDPVPWVRAESVLIIITRCRAAEQRADNAEGQVRAAAAIVDRYAAAYPPNVFPADGTTRDAIAGTALRRILPHVAGDIRALAQATPERVILTEDPTVGAIETAAGASTPAEDPAK